MKNEKTNKKQKNKIWMRNKFKENKKKIRYRREINGKEKNKWIKKNK